jgi:hypothetical protein
MVPPDSGTHKRLSFGWSVGLHAQPTHAFKTLKIFTPKLKPTLKTQSLKVNTGKKTYISFKIIMSKITYEKLYKNLFLRIQSEISLKLG